MKLSSLSLVSRFPLNTCKMSLISVGLLGALAPWAQAGVVELKSGDRLTGEVVRLEGEELVWKSALAGELRIKKTEVRNLSSNLPMKISSFRRACIMDRLEDSDLVYYCGPRVNLRRTPFLSLKTLTPYADYVNGVYRVAGKVSLWGAYSSGNEVRNEWNLQGESRLRIDEVRHVANGEYANASWNKGANKVRWHGGYSYEWFYRPRWFSYHNVSVGADENRGLDSQRAIGSGLGHQFVETERSALSQQLGVAYMDQQYETATTPNQSFDESVSALYLRTASDFRHQLVEDVAVFHTNEFMYSFDDSKDWYIKSSTGVTSRMLENIASEVKLEYWLDNQPQPTKKREDVRLSVGLSYQW